MPKQTRSRHALIAVAVVALGVAFTVGPLIFSTFSLFMYPIGQQFGWNRGEMAFALTICAICAAASHPTVGRLSDRFGSKQVLVAGLLCFSAANASLAFIGSLRELYFAHALVGVSAAASGLVPYSRLLVGWFSGRRGLALGLAIGIGSGIGSAVMVQVAQALIELFGWRDARLVLSMLMIAVPLPAVLLFLKETAFNGMAMPQADRAEGVTAPAARRDPVFWKLMCMSFFGTLCLAGAVVHLMASLIDSGMGAAWAAAVFSTCAISKAFGHVVIGYLQDRFASPRLGLLVYGFAFCGLLLIGYNSALPVTIAGAALLGLGFGAEVSLAPYWTSRFWGTTAYGSIYGQLYCASTIGSALGPLAMGAAYDAFGAYRLPLLAFAAITAGCAALNLSLPAYRFGVRKS